MGPLTDLVIHGQDIARPLSRRYVSPREVGLVFTDTGWTWGDAPDLLGSDVDLLMVAAGRSAGLAGLQGPGVVVVTPRLG